MSMTDAAMTAGLPSPNSGRRRRAEGTLVGDGGITPLTDEYLGVLAQCAQAGNRDCYARLLVEAEACLFLEGKDALSPSAEYRSAVLVALHAKLGSFKPGTSFIGWLRAIARHKARQRGLRHQGRFPPGRGGAGLSPLHEMGPGRAKSACRALLDKQALQGAFAMSRPPLPPFTDESAAEKVRLAEDGWNSRDPHKVALAYTEECTWRNRAEFLTGREEIIAFLTRKWDRELDYRLIKEIWAHADNRIAVRFAYEHRDDAGNWFRAYGNENWEFGQDGLMLRRIASINEHPIAPGERRFLWPLGRRPDEHPGLTALGF